MKKKLLAVLLASAMVLSVTACGDTGSESGGSSSETGSSSTEEQASGGGRKEVRQAPRRLPPREKSPQYPPS